MERNVGRWGAALAMVFLAAGTAAGETVTEQILLNAYDIRNIQLADQHGGGGWYVGRHSTFGRLLDGGSDRPWLPAGDSQDIYWQMVFPSPLTVDVLKIEISGDSTPKLTGSGGKIQYTTVAAPGPGDWLDLVTGINVSGSHTYTAPTDFTAQQVYGLRWLLPPEGVEDGGDWKPYVWMLHALGTNTVEVDARYNLLPTRGTVTTGGTGAWNTSNNAAAVKDNNPRPRALWHSGTLPDDAFIRLGLDAAYDLSLLWVDWEGAIRNFRPDSYDVWLSYDGSTFTKLIEDHAVTGDASQDWIDLTAYGASVAGAMALELRDFRGANGGHVIVHEIMLYGEPHVAEAEIPEPVSALLVLAGLGVLARRRRIA